jgi:hypothetical protein
LIVPQDRLPVFPDPAVMKYLPVHVHNNGRPPEMAIKTSTSGQFTIPVTLESHQVPITRRSL